MVNSMVGQIYHILFFFSIKAKNDRDLSAYDHMSRTITFILFFLKRLVGNHGFHLIREMIRGVVAWAMAGHSTGHLRRSGGFTAEMEPHYLGVNASCMQAQANTL